MLKRRHAKTWTQWTAAEDNTLRKLVAEGKTAADIAKVLTNRTIYAIHNRRGILGIHRPYKLSPRNPLRIAEVIKFKMAGWTHAEIAKVYCVSPAEVSSVLCSNGMQKFLWIRRKHDKPRRYWSETEVALLRKYLKKGYSLQQICSKFPARSPNSVRSKVIRITRYWLTPEQLAEREQLNRKCLRVDWNQESNLNRVRENFIHVTNDNNG